MKKRIAILLTMVLVAGGLGSFAYAAEPVNEVRVEFITNWEYRTSGDTFNNHEVTGEKHWYTWLKNLPDDMEELVYEPNVTLESDLTFDFIHQEDSLIGTEPYQWSFDNIPDGEGEDAGMNFGSPNPYTVTFTPGFDASRSADITEFLQSDGMQVQTITVAVTPMVTPQEKMQELAVCVNAWEDNFVNPVITSATTDGPNVYLDLDEHEVWIAVHDEDEGIATCTFTITIEVTPKVDLVEFMPEVRVEWQEIYDSGTISESPVSGIADPDDEIGIWTWTATGSYEWEWSASCIRRVTFPRVTFPREIEIVPHEPMTGQKLVGWGIYTMQPLDDGTYRDDGVLFSFTNPDCVSEITIDRVFMFGLDGNVIYDSAEDGWFDNGLPWTEPIKPHETRFIGLPSCLREPGAKIEPIPITFVTVEISWSGSEKGLPLIGWQITGLQILDEDGNMIGPLQVVTESQTQMVNMEQVLIPEKPKEKK